MSGPPTDRESSKSLGVCAQRRQASKLQLADSPAELQTFTTNCSPPRSRSCDGDLAAGPRRPVSLSEPGILPRLCCAVPGCILFAMMCAVVATLLWSQTAFYVITAALTIFTMSYSTNLSISCAVGAWRMRRDSGRDWHAQLQRLMQQDPQASRVMHIIILPNYCEDESMLLHTLENIGRSAMARSSISVVLAMEGREGLAAYEKAERLIQKASHLFADIFATFHPPNLPGEIAGKSSNTQWAYREAMRRHASVLARFDASQVFLTVGDADTLWHPQFFSALAYEGLCLPAHERVWSVWQPPILLMRNLFSCPGPTRVSGYATILFELAGLANQHFSSHFCYSAYSITLALSSHSLVSGWDRDVIAEDHHMFCKCYFASMWDQIQGSDTGRGHPGRSSSGAVAVRSSVQLRPVFLPAISYLAESDAGWFESCRARFMQARRHSQGVAELSYVLLQYARLILANGARSFPLSTHRSILSIAGKMATVHIINMVQTFALLLVGVLWLPGVASWLFAGGFAELQETLVAQGVVRGLGAQSFGGLKWAICAIFGPIPPIGMLMTATTYIVVRDVLEGCLTRDTSSSTSNGASRSCGGGSQPVMPDVQGAVAGRMTLVQRLRLFLMIQTDYFSLAHVTLIAYGLIPVVLAAWSLIRNGTRFEYIVAAKPS